MRHCQIYVVQWLLSTISNLRAYFRGIWESLYPFFWQICEEWEKGRISSFWNYMIFFPQKTDRHLLVGREMKNRKNGHPSFPRLAKVQQSLRYQLKILWSVWIDWQMQLNTKYIRKDSRIISENNQNLFIVWLSCFLILVFSLRASLRWSGYNDGLYLSRKINF